MLTEDPQFDRLRSLPFVRGIRFLPGEDSGDAGSEGTVEITTPRGEYRLSLIRKRSYLDRSVVNALIARFPAGEQFGRDDARPLLLAPYLPGPTAKSLIEAGICFADEAGNIHLSLGDEYSWTVTGERKPSRSPESERITPATIQLLFQLATAPEAAAWTVRSLAAGAGISKSKAAQLRAQLVHDRLLIERNGALQITPAIQDLLVSGYARILRPKIFLARYRHADKTAEEFLDRLARDAAEHKLDYALTGGPAADALLHIYRTPEVPLFVRANDVATLRQLRILPDRQGPVTLLRAFAPLVFWRRTEGGMVAPPWLIYAELLTGLSGRDREVAESLRQEFLQ